MEDILASIQRVLKEDDAPLATTTIQVDMQVGLEITGGDIGRPREEASAQISGVGALTANAEVVQGAETGKPKSSSFAGAVSKAVLREKSIIAFGLSFVFAISAFIGLSPWFSALVSAGALWYFVDVAVIYYRVRRGLYGGTEAEALEAARFVTHTKTRGGSGGDWDRTFEPTPTAVATSGALNEVVGARL
ncbi:MAG: hypothetical protein ACLPKW_08835 [Acetobacteraceae bacterium]